ncbi:MAG: 30S ribosomal protein S5 [Candidatus Kaiserbacteria bacterium GW2011_GWB1_52_6]|uniref:Small ribosomal subunit protein uS5 n=2 Tax=Candidatus Kaiseribacteriota TaxID=1752734 RepID=A0A0G1X614_9BACT|nr:MAG: 30S ribosomal protein S5 [Candidatus Kaiserbacteria bacterium GW2011_GWA2_52_12]KKW26255.1 MAG: 30S ribosomal protein S5 [Candidatus Kaiserbacteria bacterium GW2011_GWB1_52_6]
MSEEQKTVEQEDVVVPAEISVDVPIVADEAGPRVSERKPFGGASRRGDRGGSRDRRGGPGGGRPRRGGDQGERRSEFAQKLIGIRRVARVMAGGRRFNFSAGIVIGDKKGRVGVGLGKAADTQLAIEKATRSAKRSMINLNLTKNRSISRNVESKYCASIVQIRPSPGRGLVAGSSVRTVLELAGVSDVTAKLLSRSKNPLNNARAAIEALRKLSK